MPASDASVRADGDALVFAGALCRPAIAAVWPAATAAIGRSRRLDLRAVSRVDSAGLALLAELAASCEQPIGVEGEPPGLAELRAAYRLAPNLAFEA